MVLLGVAPVGCVNYPGSQGEICANAISLDPNHTHFLLAPSNSWGSETGLLFRVADAIARGKTVLCLLINGGEVAKKEMLEIVRRQWPAVVVQGTGRLADEHSTPNNSDTEQPDRDIAEIRSTGRISTIPLKDYLGRIERLIEGRPAMDATLMLAWQTVRRFGEFLSEEVPPRPVVDPRSRGRRHFAGDHTPAFRVTERRNSPMGSARNYPVASDSRTRASVGGHHRSDQHIHTHRMDQPLSARK